MRHYVMQIDSLNVANKQLREENAKVTRRYREVAQTASQLKQEREELTEKVTLAAKLDAVGIPAFLAVGCNCILAEGAKPL